MLQLSDKFLNDIQGATTNIYPIMVMHTNPTMYFSQVEEVIDGNHYRAANLKIPSIKESIDLESRKFKINNMTITISNYEGTNAGGYETALSEIAPDRFSDLLPHQGFLNNFVYVYWKTQSCNTLSDCLQVYKAVIKRIDHNDESVKIVLEDLTQSIVHKKVPISIIDDSIAVSEKYENVVAPMVYGWVDKAPCVLYDAESGNTSTTFSRNITISPDSPNASLNPLLNLSGSGNNYGSNTITQTDSGTASPLSIFTGRYLSVMHNYTVTENSTHSYDDLTQFTQEDNRAILTEKYSQEIPKNSIADNVMQVTVRRMAKKANLINTDSTNLNYLSSDEDIYVQEPENMVDYDFYNYDNEITQFESTYSTIPDASLNSIESYDVDDDGFIPISFFKNGYAAGSILSDNPYPYTRGQEHNESSVWREDKKGFTLRSTLHSIIYDLQDYPVEIICLPDFKKMYDWTNAKLTNNPIDVPGTGGGAQVSIAPFNQGYAQTSQWANTFQWQCYGTHQSNWHTIGTLGLRYISGQSYSYWYLYGIETDHDTYLWGGNQSMSDYWNNDSHITTYPDWQPMPHQIIKFSTDQVYESYGNLLNVYVIWGKDYEGGTYDYLDYSRIPKLNSQSEPIGENADFRVVFDFWDLMEENGYMHGDNPNFDPSIHSDIPRFKIESLLDRASDEGYQGWDATSTWVANYEAKWNQVPTDIFQNTGDDGGYTWDTTYEDVDINMARNYIPFYDYHQNYYSGGHHLTGDEMQKYGEWTFSLWYGASGDGLGLHNLFHSNEKNFYVHVKEEFSIFNDSSDGAREIKFDKGLMFPYKLMEYSDMYAGVKGHFYHGGLHSYDSEYVTLQVGNVFGDTQRIGVIYTLEESGVSDNIQDTAVTMPFCKIEVQNNGNQPDENINTSTNLHIEFLEGDVDAENLNLNFVGDLTRSPKRTDILDIYATNNPTEITNGYNMSEVHSSIWSNPDDFNSATIRFQMDTVLSSAEYQFKTNIYYLGVIHLLEIKDFLKQDYYLYTRGRVCSGSNSSFNNSSVIIEDIIKKELEVNFQTDPKWEAIKASLASNWTLAFSQTERVDSKKLIEDIAKSTPLIPLIKSNYKLSASMIANNYSSSDKIIKSSDVISYSFTRTKIENVKTMVRVRYKKDYARNSYSKKTLLVDAYDFYGNGDDIYPGGYKKSYYGLDKDSPGDSILDINNDYIRDGGVANRLRDFLLAYYCNQHNIIKLKLPLTYVDLEVTDIIEFDSLIDGVRCYGEDYTASQHYRNGQEIYKYFMITSINKGVNSISIECEQMHNLNRQDGIIAVGSGDVTRNGTYGDDLDIFELEEYLAGNRPYFTEGQLKNSDVIGDGKVTDNDLSLLIESDAYEGAAEIEGAQIVAGGATLSDIHQSSASAYYDLNCFAFNSSHKNKFLSPRESFVASGNFVDGNSDVYIFSNYLSQTVNVPYTFGNNPLSIGWYIKIDNEISRVINIYNYSADYVQIEVERGVLGTSIVSHHSNEPVVFYSSLPPEDYVEQSDVETTQQPVFTTNLKDHNYTYVGGDIPVETTLHQDNNFYDTIWVKIVSDFSGGGTHNADWLENYDIFLCHPDCYQLDDFEVSNNEEIMNTPVVWYGGLPWYGETHYSGTGQDLDPFIGYYIRIGYGTNRVEWLKITTNHQSIYSHTEALASCIVRLKRGLFNTPMHAHQAGELVEFWTSLPAGLEGLDE